MMSKAAWTLRSPGADGQMHDYFEATRFKKRRSFDVLNLSPGTYDLFVGIRRDNFFFEQSWSVSTTTSSRRNSLDEIAAKNEEAGESNEEEEDSLVEQESGTSSSNNVVGMKEHKVLRGLRTSIGAALTGGRKVISTVTRGKVGSLAVDIDVLLFDGFGIEIVSASEQLTCGDRPNYELRFVVKDTDYDLQLKIKSLSTIHSIYVFASLFQVGDEDASSSRTLKGEKDAVDDEDSALISTPTQVYDQPTQMLRRAITGSRHPERAAFARALAFACFISGCGFSIGFLFDSSIALRLAGISFSAWVIRIIVQIIAISVQV
jgi:hypothetical protein